MTTSLLWTGFSFVFEINETSYDYIQETTSKTWTHAMPQFSKNQNLQTTPFENESTRGSIELVFENLFIPPTHTRAHSNTRATLIRGISLDPPQKKRMASRYLPHPPARREQSQVSSPLQRQRPFSSSFFSQIATFTRRSIRRARARQWRELYFPLS